MRALLDTHAFLWFVAGDSRLSIQARRIIEDTETSIFLSIASVWEIAIKVSTGKLSLRDPLDSIISHHLRDNVIALLDITVDHTVRLMALPFHHRDPFDRLLIAQAMTENLPILSVDSAFDSYAVIRLW